MDFFLNDFSIQYFAIIIVGLFVLLFFYCLYDVVTSRFQGNEGMLWGLLILFAPGIGILAYLVFGKQAKLKDQKNKC